MRRALVPLVLALASCVATTSFTPMNAPPQELVAIDPSKVEVHSVQPPDKSFVDVGVFQLDDSLHPEAGAIEELRKQGGAMGCDSLVVQGPTFISAGCFSTNRYRATCIVYRRDSKAVGAQ